VVHACYNFRYVIDSARADIAAVLPHSSLTEFLSDLERNRWPHCVQQHEGVVLAVSYIDPKWSNDGKKDYSMLTVDVTFNITSNFNYNNVFIIIIFLS
jgi:hypothetical protein